MTAQEAITILRNAAWLGTDEEREKVEQAVDMAIEALGKDTDVPNTDLISRKDFDKCLEDAEKEAVRNRKYVFASALNTIRGNLRNFPSAQPERKTGRWIWNPNGMDWNLGAWCCSECKFKAETWWANDEKYNPLMCSGGHFCGNCGADMRGENHEAD